jgi:DNA excision repair protein ERCC-8
MNQLLFDRLTGALGPNAFARLQSSQLLHAILPAPRLLFDGGEREAAPAAGPSEDINAHEREVGERSWTHQAGVNALAIDIDGKMYDLLFQRFPSTCSLEQSRVWRS